MTQVRVLAGTRKGAFVLTSDGKRDKWSVSGPHFGGWEVYHMKGSPADPDRLYASQNTGWFGQLIQRSDDGGATWQPAGNDFGYAGGDPGTHLWYDGTLRPWEFKRIWHLEPSPDDPDTVYAGGGRSAVQVGRRGPDLGRADRPPGTAVRARLAAGRGRSLPAHDHPAEVADVRRDLRGGHVPVRRLRRA